MYTGRSLINDLDDASSDLSREADKYRRKIDDCRDEMQELSEVCSRNLRSIADIIIREKAGLPVEIERLLSEREGKIAGMRTRLLKIRKSIPDLDAEFGEKRKTLDELTDRLMTSVRKSEGEFHARQDVIDLEKSRKGAWETLTKIEHKLDRARSDLEENAKDYRADRIFMYLNEREYFSADYAGRGFIRTLDAWLARVSHFSHNIDNYTKLHHIPGWIEGRWEEQKRVCDGLTKTYEELYGEALEHLRALRMEKKAAEKAFNTASDRSKSSKAQVRSIENDLKDAERREDSELGHIVSVMTGKLENAGDSELRRAVIRTKTNEDDRLFDEIQDNQSRINELHRKISGYDTEIDRLEARVDEIDAVISGIRRHDWDESGHKFYNHGNIVDDLVRGAAFSHTVLPMLSRNHIAPPPVEFETYSSSNWSSDDNDDNWSSSSSFGSSSGGWSSSDSISNDSGGWETDEDESF